MGLFKEIHCAECDKKTNFLLRTKLTDGNYLCSDCTSKIPSHMMESFSLYYTLEDYHSLNSYIAESNKNLRPIFQETHHYYSIHIDTIHNLFYIGDTIDDFTLFYRFRYISDYKIIFQPETLKEGVVGNKVSGKVLFKILMNIPYFYYEKILDRNVKVKAQKAFFGTEIQYENPKGMDDFVMYFDLAFNSDRDAFYSNYENFGEDTTVASELQQAMTLFMIDDLSNVTLGHIKEQRNKLIKIFHPDKSEDNNTKYAQKINAAYEVLKQNLE